MRDAGMGFDDLLASLTTNPAKRFADPQREGKVAAGFDADVVVVKGDPANDVPALSDVKYVVRAGLLTAPSRDMLG